MSLTLREAAAVNTLLHWLLGPQVDDTTPRPHTFAARDAAELLAESAYNKLAAGINPADIQDAQWIGIEDLL